MQIHIRKAVIEDMAFVHRLVQELAEYEKEPEAVTTTVAQYEADLETGRFSVLVAETGSGVIAGMALYYPVYSTWKGPYLWLEDLVVQESFRRHGIGTLLMDALENEARAAGFPLLRWQVLDWNTPAISFYKARGAQHDATWHTYRQWL